MQSRRQTASCRRQLRPEAEPCQPGGRCLRAGRTPAAETRAHDRQDGDHDGGYRQEVADVLQLRGEPVRDDRYLYRLRRVLNA